MRHHAANVGDRGLDAGEHGRPTGGGDRADQNLAGLNVLEFFHARDHPGRPLDHAGRSGETLKFLGPRVRLRLQPPLDVLGGDAPEHDGERLGHHFRRLAQGGRRRVVLEFLEQGLALLDDGRPVSRAARLAARPPSANQVVDGFLDFEAVQVEHIVHFFEEAMLDQHFAELAHLVPEHGVMPVLDVEVVILDVGEDGAGQAELFLEGLPVFVGGQERGVLGGQPVALFLDLDYRAGDALALFDFLDVAANGQARHGHVVNPRAVQVIEAGAGGEIEPGVLRFLQLFQPFLARLALAHLGGDFVGVDGFLEDARHPHVHGGLGQPF